MPPGFGPRIRMSIMRFESAPKLYPSFFRTPEKQRSKDSGFREFFLQCFGATSPGASAGQQLKQGSFATSDMPMEAVSRNLILSAPARKSEVDQLNEAEYGHEEENQIGRAHV